MDDVLNYDKDKIISKMDEIVRLQIEHKERTLAEIIEKYDFIVGSIECKHKLMEVLPEGANVICSPYIENQTMIYAVKKFDITDLSLNLQKPFEDDYIQVPKKALKYRTAGMVAYNVEWLKDHFDLERAVICGAYKAERSDKE